MKHPEDRDDWVAYTNKGDWQIPQAPDEARPTGIEPAPPSDGDRATGPLGMRRPDPFDDRDPNPPRQSTPYNETSPWTNNQAWRYQQAPYEGDASEHRGEFLKILGLGAIIGIGLLVLAVIVM